MSEAISAALLVEVQWGVIPGTAEGSKKWGFTRDQVAESESWQQLMAEAYDEFNQRMHPAYSNWVTLTWLWV